MTKKDTPRLEEQKAALLEGFRQVRAAILETARRIDPQDIIIPFIGTWNILDLLAHLRGWDFTNLQAAKDILQGKLPDFYYHHDKNWASYNAGLVAQHKRASLNQMLKEVEESQDELIGYLMEISPEGLLTDQGVRHGSYKVIISRLIQAEIKDEARHLNQIEAFLKSLDQ